MMRIRNECSSAQGSRPALTPFLKTVVEVVGRNPTNERANVCNGLESGHSVDQPNRSKNETKNPGDANRAWWERPGQRTLMRLGGSLRVATDLFRRQEEKGTAQGEKQSNSRLHGARLAVS